MTRELILTSAWCFPTLPENSGQWSVTSDQKLSDQSPPATDHCSLTTDNSGAAGAAACGGEMGEVSRNDTKPGQGDTPD